jgi:hypothetical protein
MKASKDPMEVTKRGLNLMSFGKREAVLNVRRAKMWPTLPKYGDDVIAPIFEPNLSHEGSQGFMRFECPICFRTNSHGCDYPFTPYVHHRGGHCGCYPTGYYLRVDPTKETN